MSLDAENPYRTPESTHSPRSVEAESSDTNLANRGSRLVAKLIDGLISNLILMPLMFLTGYFQRAIEQNVSIFEVAIYSIAGFLLYYAIHGYLLATQGQTVGKMLMAVRIVDYDSGQLIPIGRMIGLRDLPVMLASMIPYIGGVIAIVDALFIFTKEQRCVHDLIAKTKVVKVEKL